MAAHNELGKWGEDLAVAFLQRQGYTIIERDWKSGRRDIDIIAKDETGTIVFVEVKTRRNRLFGEPEEAIDYRKMQSLQQATNTSGAFQPVASSLLMLAVSRVEMMCPSMEERNTVTGAWSMEE